MRTTLDIDEELVSEVMRVAKAKTKKGAIVTALKEYLKVTRRQELRDMIGAYDEFDLSLDKICLLMYFFMLLWGSFLCGLHWT